MFRECREALWQLGVVDVLRRLSGSPDPVTQKYLQRIQTKLQAANPPPSSSAAAQ